MLEEGEKLGYIYLIRERESLLLKQPVYKVGMTCQAPDKRIKRLDKYKKGSEVLIIVRVMDTQRTAQVENKIKQIFYTKYEKHNDGNEYFIGNGFEMQKIIMEVVQAENIQSSGPYLLPTILNLNPQVPSNEYKRPVLNAIFL
jgi:hypothetical protein